MKIYFVCSEEAEGPKCVSASVSTDLILCVLRSRTTKTLELGNKVVLWIVCCCFELALNQSLLNLSGRPGRVESCF